MDAKYLPPQNKIFLVTNKLKMVNQIYFAKCMANMKHLSLNISLKYYLHN